MQLYSLVVTRDAALRAKLARAISTSSDRDAGALRAVTVCANMHRFSMWCEQRDADPAYDD